MTPALATRDLSIGYRSRQGARVIVSHINISAGPGQLVCVLGANGTGKSTLLRTLSRLQSPLSGSIAIDGFSLSALTARDLATRVAVVVTERVSVDALTVRALVGLGRYSHSGWLGSLNDRDIAVIEDALAATGAASLAHRMLHQLSDGERQRVMLARALAQEPRVLLLDEPTVFLDVAARVEAWALLRRLAVDRRVTVIVSTHDLELALASAHRLWLMSGDRIHDGEADELVDSGAIAAAFERTNVIFDATVRGFRFSRRDSGEGTWSQ
jgi:iron complex transport system ATP-binding protein